jgi:hypothetical protein
LGVMDEASGWGKRRDEVPAEVPSLFHKVGSALTPPLVLKKNWLLAAAQLSRTPRRTAGWFKPFRFDTCTVPASVPSLRQSWRPAKSRIPPSNGVSPWRSPLGAISRLLLMPG